MNKNAITSVPINPLATKRWSPRAFSDRHVEPEKLQAMFEAARWSASAGNEQPWRFIAGIRGDDTWSKIFSCLDNGNQVWNKTVPVLILAMGHMLSAYDGKESPYWQYDTGQAVAHLSLEAMHQGLFVHQMGGFSKERAQELFGLPATTRPLSVIAAGYPGDPDTLPEKLRERELQPRKRKELREIIISGNFVNS